MHYVSEDTFEKMVRTLIAEIELYLYKVALFEAIYGP